MEFSRAVLAACASALGILFYAISALLLVLAVAILVRADPAGPSLISTLVPAGAFAAAGLLCRFISRKIV
jgi:hypothetical protein